LAIGVTLFADVSPIKVKGEMKMKIILRPRRGTEVVDICDRADGLPWTLISTDIFRDDDPLWRTLLGGKSVVVELTWKILDE